MNAAVINEYGGPEAVGIADVPVPKPGPGEVLIRVGAAALNNSDLQTTHGGYGRRPLPHILGQEAAGTVDAVGPEVAGLTAGNRVAGRVTHSFAEFATANANDLVLLPDDVPFDVAASLPIAYLTAGIGLVHRARVRSSEWVLVQAASGGVGTAAVQLAKLLGARVIATAGSGWKLDRLADLGADHGVNYSESDVATEVRRITGDEGVAVALDGAGRDTFPACLESVGSNGRVVVYGSVSGRETDLSLGTLLRRNISLYGISVWTNDNYANGVDLLRTLVLPGIQDGRLQPAIDRIVGLDGVSDALGVIERREHFSKIVVIP